MKVCSRCKIEKNLDYFNKDKNKKDNRCNNCKQCSAEMSREWRNKNPERQAELLRKNYLENREDRLAKAKQWRQDNRNLKREHNRTRKALLRGLASERYTETQVIEFYGTTCHLCGFAIDMDAPRQTGKSGWQGGLQIDHVIPLSLGGPNTIDNVRPSHGICNLRKSNSSVL